MKHSNRGLKYNDKGVPIPPFKLMLLTRYFNMRRLNPLVFDK